MPPEGRLVSQEPQQSSRTMTRTMIQVDPTLCFDASSRFSFSGRICECWRCCVCKPDLRQLYSAKRRGWWQNGPKQHPSQLILHLLHSAHENWSIKFVRSIIAIPATRQFPLRREGDQKLALHPRSAVLFSIPIGRFPYFMGSLTRQGFPAAARPRRNAF